MSLATRTETQSPALHVADSHDLIRVQGARCPSLFTQVFHGPCRATPKP
jgi:hypothetical protein